MRNKKFTDQEKKILLENPNILKVGDSQITYSSEFKLKAIDEYNNGKMPIPIFTDAQINIDILGRKNAQRALERWRSIVKKFGEAGLLEDQRGKSLSGKSLNGGRPKTKPLSIEEKIKQLKARNAYLEAENDFLKKLKALKGGMI